MLFLKRFVIVNITQQFLWHSPKNFTKKLNEECGGKKREFFPNRIPYDRKGGHMLEIGSLVEGTYRILRKCGQGGMSVVYMARNERTGRIWAIKEIEKSGIRDFALIRQGLFMELEMLKKLRHPQLPEMIDILETEKALLIVMDYIEGTTLRDMVKHHGALPQEEVIEWGRQLCSVIGYLHAQEPPVIYRDMKPSNVMLRPDGRLVLLDLGAAREYKAVNLEDTVCLGTRGYAAPEQYGGQGQSDERTDIYGLGATMYHLLTGYGPGESAFKMRPVRQLNPELSPGMERILRKCTEDSPKERYQSAAELAYALEHYREEDESYRKLQVGKLKRFLIWVLLTVFLSMGAFLSRGLERKLVKNQYEGYLAEAKHAISKEDELLAYCRAVNLMPGEGQAYQSLLEEGFLDDQLLTREESRLLRSLMIEYGNGRTTNEEQFRNNRKDYEVFAYTAGIAYYYQFEEKSMKKYARGYLEEAAESRYLNPEKKKRARRLYAITDYYSRLGKADETGEDPVTYQDYWEDLDELTAGNLVEEDNERTALIMYQELAAQMISHAEEFQRDGVSREEILLRLQETEERLSTDFSRAGEEALLAEKEKLKGMLVRARRMTEAVYEERRRETR